MPVKRFDFAKFDVSNLRRTPSGGVIVPACLTRTGVFVYQTTDGKTVREYRAPSEVAAQASLDSLANAPVTVKHPEGSVTPDNWASVSKGNVVAGSVRIDGGLLNADLAVQEAKTVDLVLSKELVEISCGYSCDLVEQAGVSPEGEAYDRMQVNITYNHVALGPQGWGRAGEICSIKLDSKGEMCLEYTHLPQYQGKAKERMKHSVEKKGSLLRVDGVEFNLRTKAGRENGQKALLNIAEAYSVEVRNIRKDDAADAIKMLENVLEMLKSMAGPMTEEPAVAADADAEKQPVPDANAPNKDADNEPQAKDQNADPNAKDAEIEARADERATIIAKAKLLNPKVETKGKKNAEIMRDALAAHNVRVDGSEERLRGAFDIFQVPPTGRAPHPTLHDARGPVPNSQRSDSGSSQSFEEASRNNAANAWKSGKAGAK